MNISPELKKIKIGAYLIQKSENYVQNSVFIKNLSVFREIRSENILRDQIWPIASYSQ